MRRVAVSIVLASLVAAGAARADGLPVLGIDVGATGVVAPSGEERYVTMPAGTDTVVARVGTADGRIVASRLLPGALTIPAVAYDGSASGLSGDGRRLVLIAAARRASRAGAPASRCSTRAASSPAAGSTCAATSASTPSRRTAGSST